MRCFVECAFSGAGVNAGTVWEKLAAVLPPIPDTVHLYGKDVKVAHLSSRFALRDGKQFRIEYENQSIRFAYVVNCDVYFLRIDPLVNIDLRSLVLSLASVNGFLSAMVIDDEYERWQNAESLQFFELSGRPTAALTLKPNGLPPPLDGEVVDTSKNPGRRLLRDRYIESIGHRMWLSSAFWAATGGNKGVAMGLLKGVAKLEEVGELLSVTVGSQPFNDTTPRSVQDHLRSALFLQSSLAHLSEG